MLKRDLSVNSSPESLMMLAAQSNPDFFAPIYESYFPRIYAYCLRGVDHPAEAEDLTSQIFTRALVGLARYEGGSVAVWLFRIAHNALANYYRDRRSHLSWDEMELPDPHPGPGAFIVELEERQALARSVAALPANQRELLALKIDGGLTSQEIGALLGKSAAAVRVELHRIMTRLRADVLQERGRS